jgi:hypothetical protein
MGLPRIKTRAKDMPRLLQEPEKTSVLILRWIFAANAIIDGLRWLYSHFH